MFYTIAFPPLSARRHREAAVFSGIRVDRIVVFMISGVMAAISGILLIHTDQLRHGLTARRYRCGRARWNFEARGVGTILGALIISVINNGMNMLSVPYFYRLIVKGLVICRLARHS